MMDDEERAEFVKRFLREFWEPSPEEVEMVNAAIARMDSRRDESAEEWAKQLGSILGKYTD